MSYPLMISVAKIEQDLAEIERLNADECTILGKDPDESPIQARVDSIRQQLKDAQ
jgi:hypothetical protein